MRNFQLHPIRKILLPIDFSSSASNAADYAVKLAKILESKILLYHAVHIPVMTANDIVIPLNNEKLEKESVSELNKIKSGIALSQKFNDVEVLATSGFAVDEITRLEKEQKTDLVIMGTKGASGISEVLIGSNTAEVISKSNCPVLVIPENAKFTPPKKVVFSTNYADNDFQTLYLLAEMLKPFNTEIIVLHVDEQGTHQLEDRMLEWFKGQVQTNIPYDKFSFNLVSGKHVSNAIDTFIQDNKVDILAVSTRKRNFFDKLTSHSLTRKLAYHTHIPLLAFHAHAVSSTPLF